jgi:hypothetical protein
MQCFARFPWFLGDSLKIFDPCQKISQGDPGFHARQCRAKAGMDAVAEGNVRWLWRDHLRRDDPMNDSNRRWLEQVKGIEPSFR